MKKLNLVFLLALLTINSFAQIDYKKFDEYVSNSVKDFNVVGLAIAVVKDSQIVFSKAYGFADLEKEIPLTTKSLFNIASCTKSFTAALTAKLVDEGKLSFNERVVDQLPNFQLSDIWITNQLNITDILSHRSGLKTFAGDLLWYHTGYSNNEIIERMKYLPIENEFRSEFGYQNNMFMIASEIISKKVEEPWYKYMEKEFFNKLDMNSTKISSRFLNTEDNIAFPHVDGKRYELSIEEPNAAGSIFSSVEEMSNWISMLLNNGNYKSKQILSKKSIEQIFTPHTNVRLGRSMLKMGANFHAYGLGWFMYDYFGRKIIYHDGGMPGYVSRVLLVPKENIGVVILTNDLNPLTSALSQQIIDLYFGDKNADWCADYKIRVEKYKAMEKENEQKENASRIENTSPSLSIENYQGVFNDDSYGKARVFLNDKNLYLELPAKDVFTGQLKHWHYDTFKVKFKDEYLPEGFVTFNFNSRGEVIGFKIDLENPDFHFNDLNFIKID